MSSFKTQSPLAFSNKAESTFSSPMLFCPTVPNHGPSHSVSNMNFNSTMNKSMLLKIPHRESTISLSPVKNVELEIQE